MHTWQIVPKLVKTRYKVAQALQRCVALHDCDAVWQPETATIFIKLAEDDVVKPTFPSMYRVVALTDKATPGIVLKTAAGWLPDVKLSDLGAPYRAAGQLAGGPTALTNGLVSGAIGAGGGYLAGSLMSNLLPEQYVNRKNLARRMALMGGLGGMSLHIPEYIANLRLNAQANKDPNDAKSVGDPKYLASLYGHPESPSEKWGSTTGFTGMDSPIRVDAFNNVIWGSTNGNPSTATPPVVAAATTGMLTGVQQMYGNSNILTPRHMIMGLAAAGTDMATAHVAGATLGALGLITPKAQEKIRDMGLWSGMLRGVATSVFGL